VEPVKTASGVCIVIDQNLNRFGGIIILRQLDVRCLKKPEYFEFLVKLS